MCHSRWVHPLHLERGNDALEAETGRPVVVGAAPEKIMEFILPPLPYSKQALEPHMGRETLDFHYEKHHRGYLAKLEAQIADEPTAALSLEEIIQTSKGPVYNFASQVWNHTFFWESMCPDGGGPPPSGDVADAIGATFGSYDAFRTSFIEAGTSRFGSGYLWLVDSGRGLRCITTPNADAPWTDGSTPIVTCDLWEHAYYLDHRNERRDYLETFLDHLIDWERAASRLESARKPTR